MENKHSAATAVFYASSADCISRAIRHCDHDRGLGVIMVIRDESPNITESIQCVFNAHQAAGWRGSLWIVVVADHCDKVSLTAARRVVGAFGQVLQADAGSMQASYAIGQALVAQHFAGKPAQAVAFVARPAACARRLKSAPAGVSRARRLRRAPMSRQIVLDKGQGVR